MTRCTHCGLVVIAPKVISCLACGKLTAYGEYVVYEQGAK
jgi:uncharacterized OB-fold protein